MKEAIIMTDSDPRSERPEDPFNPSPTGDGHLEREPSVPEEARWERESAAPTEAQPADRTGSENAAPSEEAPAYQRAEWSHSSHPDARNNVSIGTGSPTRGPRDSRDLDELSQRQRRTKRIIGFVAVLLTVAILFSAGTAAVVYNIVASRNPQQTAATTSPTSPATGSTSPSATTGGTQSTTPANSGSSQPLTTNKFFSIADASTKSDPNRQALTVMEIAKRNKPAVVAISTEARMQNQFGQTGLVEAAGSGFIITADGYVVTNFHVIDGAQTITVALDDGRLLPAVITGTDSRNDIAVLKINGTGLPTVKLGISKNLEVGELAVAIGNALGELKGTVTAGIISATDRQITIDNQSLVLLQTDAAINSGNSGGALINSFGEVIGINTAKNAGTGVEGLGFAIPIDIAKPIIESLIKNGYVSGRPKLGIGTRDVTQQMAQYYNMHEGVYVRSVEAGSAAALAGIAVGDVIIKADGKDTLTTDALNAAKESHKVGDTMKITLVRNAKEITVDVVLKEDIPDNVQQTATKG